MKLKVHQLFEENQSRLKFTRLWRFAEPTVSAYIFAAVCDFHDAEDVLQQVAQDAARRFDSYDPDRPFVAWVVWIAKSRVIDFYRLKSRDRLVFPEGLLEQLAATVVEQSTERLARREALEKCLDELPERSRRLLNLRYVDECNSSEIASALGSTGGSIRVMLTKIRRALSDCVRRRLELEG